MSNENILLAKEIFLKYGGSHFHMEREGEYKYYKSFNISKEQEILWLNEYMQEILAKIESENIVSPFFSELIDAIIHSKDTLCFRSLLELIKRKKNYDTFSKVLVSEEILKIVDYFKEKKVFEDKEVIINLKKIFLDILKDIPNNPIVVASYYKELGFLNDKLSEEEIINRTKRLIKKWSNI